MRHFTWFPRRERGMAVDYPTRRVISRNRCQCSGMQRRGRMWAEVHRREITHQKQDQKSDMMVHSYNLRPGGRRIMSLRLAWGSKTKQIKTEKQWA